MTRLYMGLQHFIHVIFRSEIKVILWLAMYRFNRLTASNATRRGLHVKIDPYLHPLPIANLLGNGSAPRAWLRSGQALGAESQVNNQKAGQTLQE